MSIAQKKTFTLIEMLIVIVIIGILAAALIPRLQSIQGRARDSKRKADLRAIYNANEIYLLDYGQYVYDRKPLNPAASRDSYDAVPWMPELSGMMGSIPIDPLNIKNGYLYSTGTHIYEYSNLTTGTVNSYGLAAKLENRQDSDRCASKAYVYRNVGANAYLNVFCGAEGIYTYFYDPAQLKNGKH